MLVRFDPLRFRHRSLVFFFACCAPAYSQSVDPLKVLTRIESDHKAYLASIEHCSIKFVESSTVLRDLGQGKGEQTIQLHKSGQVVFSGSEASGTLVHGDDQLAPLEESIEDIHFITNRDYFFCRSGGSQISNLLYRQQDGSLTSAAAGYLQAYGTSVLLFAVSMNGKDLFSASTDSIRANLPLYVVAETEDSYLVQLMKGSRIQTLHAFDRKSGLLKEYKSYSPDSSALISSVTVTLQQQPGSEFWYPKRVVRELRNPSSGALLLAYQAEVEEFKPLPKVEADVFDYRRLSVFLDNGREHMVVEHPGKPAYIQTFSKGEWVRQDKESSAARSSAESGGKIYLGGGFLALAALSWYLYSRKRKVS